MHRYLRRYEGAGDGKQSLVWPGEEPVNAGVVHHAREVTTPRPQRLAHWRHGHDDV